MNVYFPRYGGMVMEEKNLILKKYLLSVIMFATYFPNAAGRERKGGWGK